MPLKPRQQSRNQKSTASSSGSNVNSASKTKTAAQFQPVETTTPQYPDPNAFLPPCLASLRRDGRWAAISQFLYTFQGPLRIDPYIEVELEEDLAYGSDLTLSRIVHRLLFTLAQDRKITPQNWMGYLQGQYARRYTPLPNPFYQDIPSPAPITDLIKPEAAEQEEGGQSTPASEAPDADPTTEDKPAEPSAEPVPNPTPDAEVKPAPEDPTLTETKPSVESTPPPIIEPPPPPPVPAPPMRQWHDLSQSEQLDVLWTLCEWQFQGAMRLRSLLGEEDSGVGWRMEPVGWDSKKNTYWLVGETRLWIQHHVPLPKLPPKKKSRMTRTVIIPFEPTFSSRAPPPFDSDSEGEPVPEPEPEPASIDSESELSDAPPAPSKTKTRKRGAEESTDSARKRVRRVSLRLRGAGQEEEDGWQAEEENGSGTGAGKQENGAGKIDDPFGSDSDLTEVDELERELEEDRRRREKAQKGRKKRGKAAAEKPKPKPKVKLRIKTPEVEEEEEEKEEKQLPTRLHVAPLVDPMLPLPLPPGFIEWETICSTLQDWEAFPKRFEKATHPNEKSFRSFLNNVLVPTVATSLRAQLKVKKLETAVQNRKRSSRIAIKESIVEAQRKEEERRVEEMELHARSRRVEERERRAQEEAIRRERDRETNVRSRETRASGRRGLWDGETTSGSASPAPDYATPDPPVKIRLRTGGRTFGAASPVSADPSSSGTSSRADEPWELLCEGCGKQGWNIDDGSQLVKCESCGRWSHTTCHDRADELAGKPRRDWSLVDFTCRACSNTARKPNGVAPAPKTNEAASKTNGTTTPPAPAYMYTSFQAVPNGHVPTQPSAYPQSTYVPPSGYPVNGVPQPVYGTNGLPLPTYGVNGVPQAAYGTNGASQVAYPAPSPVHAAYGVNGVPQAPYTVQAQPRGAPPPAFAAFVQHQPVPMPQYQTPVPPVSQPPSYPYPYPNGYPAP